ncbi:Abi family protein [Chitinophaga silvisoli]|uniref:Abi family protein n=1 Tax=Chitinophaga silvisoli TaxID=2291814 RepID=A0A3E1P301_9BACT|nr:Abi family protein [Chitinophaga silvisoli]RFM34561.1 Abi family protein [Chitinophaga silvisoli]
MNSIDRQFPLLSDQFKILQQRGLKINDSVVTNHYLAHVGYYRLADYWQFFHKEKISNAFVVGTTFDQVIELYNFDRELRLLLLDAIERIEVSFRAIMINMMCPIYGSNWFTDKMIFFDEGRLNGVVETIDRELDRSDEECVKLHDKKKSGFEHPPAWKTLPILSFGTLSKIYRNIKNDIKEKRIIAKVYGLPQGKWLQSWIQVVAILRNYCAHHSLICYRTFSFLPKEIGEVKLPWIKGISSAGSIESKQLYYQLCIVRYLLHTASPGNDFSYRLMELFVKYRGIDLERMGFLENWDEEDLWQ